MWLCGGGYPIRHQVKMERFIKVNDISTLLSVSPKTVYYWVHSEYIPHYRLSKGIRFKASEIETWMKRRKRKGRVNYRFDIEN